MPYYRTYWRYRRRPWNRRRFRFWRPRKTFRTRYRRRNRWVRKKKLKTLKLKVFQPKCIRRCKVKGLMSLLEFTNVRFSNNFDMYELSTVPETLSGGGGFSIKNFSLNSLFAENLYKRNIWTHSNQDLPLVRYTGCTFKFYQNRWLDYIVSYSNSEPLTSNLELYQSMHPAIHGLQQHKKIIPSRETRPHKKPYHKIKIKPPTPLTNKWYFAQDLSKTPLVQIRTSSTSLDEYYLKRSSVNTNITIPFLNISLIQNRQFKTLETSGYYARIQDGDKIYIYTSLQEGNINDIPLKTLTFLGNTKDNQEGVPISTAGTTLDEMRQKYIESQWGNPFFADYLNKSRKIYQTKMSLSSLITKLSTSPAAKVSDISPDYGFTETYMVNGVRYNPYKDSGHNNKVYFKSAVNSESGWDPPENPLLVTENLPLWLACYGFADFQKKLNITKNIDTEQILTIQCTYTSPKIYQHWPIINPSWIEGYSPEEDHPDIGDTHRWWLSFQFQQLITNDICLSGPGSPKLNKDISAECKCAYTFYFKFGGNPPPMQPIEDPKTQDRYPLPSNFKQTNSLQNPATAPEQILWSFDERRSMLTTKAIRRLQTDWDTKTTIISDGEQRHVPEIQAAEKETSTESSSEEETTETLLDKLHKQRLKQKLLKQRILAAITKQQLE
nr:MAG: ORF1 [TTV-like mini virus]